MHSNSPFTGDDKTHERNARATHCLYIKEPPKKITKSEHQKRPHLTPTASLLLKIHLSLLRLMEGKRESSKINIPIRAGLDY